MTMRRGERAQRADKPPPAQRDEHHDDYEVVKHGYGKGKRPDVETLSGQSKLPVLELSDGQVYRAESDEMAARVRSGGVS